MSYTGPFGTLGRHLFTVNTTASAVGHLGAGTVGNQLFTAAATASALNHLGPGAVGLSLFTAATTASAKGQLGLITSTTDHAVARFNGTGGDTQNSPVIVEDNGALHGYAARTEEVSATVAYTFVSADSGKTKIFNTATTCSVRLRANMGVGFWCSWVQKGAGVIEFVAATSATLTNRQSHTKSAGAGAGGSLLVDTNIGGSAATWYLFGDTA